MGIIYTETWHVNVLTFRSETYRIIEGREMLLLTPAPLNIDHDDYWVCDMVDQACSYVSKSIRGWRGKGEKSIRR